jgi:AraC-like DNA-binding protein
MDTQAKLNVLISHSVPLVSAGLASTLQEVPECQVRVWDDNLQRQYGSLHAFGADIVLSDLDQGVRLLEDCGDSVHPASRTSVPKVLVLTADQQDGSVQVAIQRGAVGCLSMQCRREDLIGAVRKLAHVLRGGESQRLSSARGGMAPGALRRVREFIEQHIAAKISLEELAEVAGLSAGHFSRAFRQSVGMPPHRYLQHRRIQLAAELIRGTCRPLSEIACSVGFSDQSHFTRAFVCILGATPAVFRRRHR